MCSSSSTTCAEPAAGDEHNRVALPEDVVGEGDAVDGDLGTPDL